MLEYARMYTVGRMTTRVGLAFLVVILPNTVAFAISLREEAVNYRLQGYEAQRRGDTPTALSFYQKAIALDPSYPTPYNDAGILLEEAGRFEEAEKSYRQALTLNPNYLEAHANIAMLYERANQKEKAVYHWMKRYELGDPYDPWTVRAEERLIALGALKAYAGVKGRAYSHRRVIGKEFQAHDQSLEEFHAVTEEHGDWP